MTAPTRGAVELAGRHVDAGVADRARHLVDADAAHGQRIGIDLDAHRRPCLAENLRLRDAVDRRQLADQQILDILDRLRDSGSVGELTVRKMIEPSAGLTLRIDGGEGMSRGSWRAAAEIAD